MEEERDLVVFSDEDGNEFELEVIDYFEHEGQEYAALIDAEPDEKSEEPIDVYIMKIVVDGDMEEFLPADEDKMEILSKILEDRMAEWDDECEEDCDKECGTAECPKKEK